MEEEWEEEGQGGAPWRLIELCCALADEAWHEEGLGELCWGLVEDDMARTWKTRVGRGGATIEVLSKPTGSPGPYRPEWLFEGQALREAVRRTAFQQRMEGDGEPQGPLPPAAVAA